MAVVADAVPVFVSMGQEAVDADVVIAAVAFLIAVKVIMVRFAEMTVAEEKLADIALLIAVGIYAAESR